MRRVAIVLATLALFLADVGRVHAACPWGWPVGDAEGSPAPTADNHPVGGMNLPEFGAHLGADFWSGGGCTDLGRTVWAVADGEIVEIVDGLGSYLDVIVVRHDDVGVGTVYAMYGHIARDDALAEGDLVGYRQPLGTIADVLAYFSPCHLHFELLNENAFAQGPFCNGCANAGYNVSPGYDQQMGVVEGVSPSGDPYLEVDDAIADNRWYRVDEFIEARAGQDCGDCGDGNCGGGESFELCPRDCEPCAWIGPAGETLDESGACFSYGGDPMYWHVQTDTGHDGTLRWTHATDSEMVDNTGTWSFAFTEAGDYDVEVWIDDTYGHSAMAAYQLVHGAGGETVVLDQDAASGWAPLGTFAFTQGGAQSMRLDDNTGEPFASMVPLVFDAVRLTRVGGGDGTGSDEGSASVSTTDPSGSDGGSADATGGSGGEDGDATSITGTGDGPALPGGANGGGSDGCGCANGARPRDAGAVLLILLSLRVARPRSRCSRRSTSASCPSGRTSLR